MRPVEQIWSPSELWPNDSSCSPFSRSWYIFFLSCNSYTFLRQRVTSLSDFDCKLFSLYMKFIHSFIHSFTHSFIHSFIYYLLSSLRWPIFFALFLTKELGPRLFIHLFIHSFICAFVCSFFHSFIQSVISSSCFSFPGEIGWSIVLWLSNNSQAPIIFFLPWWKRG